MATMFEGDEPFRFAPGVMERKGVIEVDDLVVTGVNHEMRSIERGYGIEDVMIIQVLDETRFEIEGPAGDGDRAAAWPGACILEVVGSE